MFGCCGGNGDAKKSKENPREIEKKIMELTGMSEPKDFLIYDVQLPKSKGVIHTIEAGFNQEQQIVLVHGYGATGIFNYKLINILRKYFHVYAIDLYGFGQSSRPKIPNFEFEDCCKFFIDPLEEWRQLQRIEDFVLLAHSLGAYLMTQYMRIAKPPVKMLYLVSPAGFTLKTVDQIKERMSQYVSGFQMLTIKFSFYLMEDLRVSPFHTMFLNRDQAIENFFRHERMGLSKTEVDLFCKYYKAILDLPACGEKALGTFLFYGCYSKKPLCTSLKKIRDDICNVRIFYGDADWMDFEHAIEANVKENIKYDIQIVPNSGHQIILQNPLFLSNILLDDLMSNYDPYKYFEQEYGMMARHSYLNTSKEVLQYMSKNATDLTMMKET